MSHRPHQLAPRPFRTLDSAADAVDLARMSIEPTTLAVALLEDTHARQGFALTIESDGTGGTGGEELRAVERLDQLLCNSLEQPPGRRLAIVTARPAGAPAPVLDDLDLWDRLVERHMASPLELLDWIVLTGERGHVSLADEMGPAARW